MPIVTSRLGALLLVLGAVVAAPSFGTVAAGIAEIEATVTGSTAERMYDRLQGVRESVDWEDALIPAIYETRHGAQVTCTRSVIPGPGADWTYSCRFRMDERGKIAR